MKINYEDTITLIALAGALIMTIYLEQKDLASVIVGVLGGYIGGATGSAKRSQYLNNGGSVDEKKECEK
ncbi:hypothetical protein LI139_10305 [Veillonella atypica]|jgi:hypothetical protein|uniref:hypothetical protein n=1 Tax=Veillonella atypica TaxID=39777 RepID=UPI001D07321F|nr:hypothetical protein [Veillonella atypica]MCB6516034.1 hypothetical protein [Veillonella atypica]DAX83241.1 MAG TPA: hypothetical protein [Caudoviricetes sp.]